VLNGKNNASILILEDNPALSRLYGKVLNQAGYHVYLALTINDARALLFSQEHFDIFLCDLQVGQELSLELLREIKSMIMQRHLQVVVIIGSMRFRLAPELASAYLIEKPIDVNVLQAMITRVLATRNVQNI